MLTRYKNQTNLGVGIGIVLQIVGNVINAQQMLGPSSASVGGLVAIIGLVFFI